MSRVRVWRFRTGGQGKRRSILGWICLQFVILCLCCATSTATAAAATAGASVGISSVVGFAGYFGQNHWVPVDVTLHNTGRARNAALVLEINNQMTNNRVAIGTSRWPIRLPSNGWRHVEIAVPGDVLAGGGSPVVQCEVDGQTVAQTYLSGNALGNISLVAVLTTQSQETQFLIGSTGPSGDPVLSVAVSPIELPTAANLLNVLTAVVATPDSLRALTAAQYDSLMTWVKLGGLLIVTGTGTVPNVTPGKRQVQEMPLLPGPYQEVPASKLVTYAGSTASTPKKIVIYARGAVPRATILAGTAKKPLLAAVDVGRGRIVQSSFWPNQPALLGWPSNVGLWTNVLKQGSTGNQSALPSLLDPSANGILSMTSASDALTPLRVPSLRFWTGIFGLYTIIAGPALFFVLRRRKMESWAWGILPVLSVLTTIGIYTFGASQRPSGVLTEGVGVLDLTGDGQAEAYGIRAFMSPSVSSASVVTDQPMLVLPMAEQNVGQLGKATVVNGDRSVASFQNVGRWGIRYIYVAGAVRGQKQVSANLESTFGLLGTIRNDTAYPLHDVALCWNGKMFALGDMAPGASITINQATESQSVPTSNWLLAYSAYNRDITHGIGRSLGAWASNLLSPAVENDQAMLIATTDGTTRGTPGLPTLRTNEKIASEQTLVLVRQFLPVTMNPLG